QPSPVGEQPSAGAYLFQNDWFSMFAGSVFACIALGIGLLWLARQFRKSHWLTPKLLFALGILYLCAGIAHGAFSGWDGWRIAQRLHLEREYILELTTTGVVILLGAAVIAIWRRWKPPGSPVRGKPAPAMAPV